MVQILFFRQLLLPAAALVEQVQEMVRQVVQAVRLVVLQVLLLAREHQDKVMRVDRNK
jgi:hypothetical protein